MALFHQQNMSAVSTPYKTTEKYSPGTRKWQFLPIHKNNSSRRPMNMNK